MASSVEYVINMSIDQCNVQQFALILINFIFYQNTIIQNNYKKERLHLKENS